MTAAGFGGWRVDADVDVVGFGEEPAVAAGEWAEVEDEVVGAVGGGEGRGESGVGDEGFEGEGFLEARSRVQGPGPRVREVAGLAVAAVGADEDRAR